MGATWDAPCESVVAVDANFAAASSSVAESLAILRRAFSGDTFVNRRGSSFTNRRRGTPPTTTTVTLIDARVRARAKMRAFVSPELDASSDGSAAAAKDAECATCAVFPLASATSTDEGAWRVEGGAWRVEYHDGVRGSSLDHAEQEVMAEASSRVFSTERAAADFFFEKEDEKEDEKDEKDGGAREPVGSGSVEPKGSGPGVSITGEGTHVFWHPDAHFMFREVASAARRVVDARTRRKKSAPEERARAPEKT